MGIFRFSASCWHLSFLIFIQPSVFRLFIHLFLSHVSPFLQSFFTALICLREVLIVMFQESFTINSSVLSLRMRFRRRVRACAPPAAGPRSCRGTIAGPGERVRGLRDQKGPRHNLLSESRSTRGTFRRYRVGGMPRPEPVDESGPVTRCETGRLASSGMSSVSIDQGRVGYLPIAGKGKTKFTQLRK
jgi:hypothetical protein